jgi:hypothetical protein
VRILVTNLQLWPRSGTVTYVRDLVLGLQRRGEAPAVFSLDTGPVCEELRAAGVPVVSRLRDLPWVPDVIHGHHGAVLRLAIHAFPGVPAINVCHDHLSPHERAVLHPAVRRYFAVSALCRRRQLAEGVPEAATGLLPNFVDVERFVPRPPLPRRPRRALVFSNYATESTQLPAIRDACARAGLAMDVVGVGVGRPVDAPEQVLPHYDVVFGKAKAALEAMAVGTAVVLCDFGGVGPLVHSTAFDALQRLNFGREALTEPLTADALLRQLDRYDADDVPHVRTLVQARASLAGVLDTLQRAYTDCVRQGVPGRGTSPRQRLEVTRAGLALGVYWSWISMPPRHQAWLRRLRLNAVAREGLAHVLTRAGDRSRTGER